MATSIEIANKALQLLGDARITSFNDRSKQAREMNSGYATIRDSELTLHNWTFATKRALLPALAEVPAYQWPRAFQFPSDCLAIVEVDEYYNSGSSADYISDSDVPYQLEGRTILTSLAAPLKVRYVYRVEDTTIYPPSFVDALSHRLAIDLCMTITESANRKQSLLPAYAQILRDAYARNECIRAPESLRESEWVEARL